MYTQKLIIHYFKWINKQVLIYDSISYMFENFYWVITYNIKTMIIVKVNIMKELSDFQKNLKQLNAPYKKSEAYVVFGDNNSKGENVSSFWNTDAGYVPKYKSIGISNTIKK